jgi:lactose/cellobiose-specific phosphotransferase system IIC component
MAALIETLSRINNAVANNRYSSAVRGGLINLIPLVMLGAFATAAVRFPIPGFPDLLNSVTGGIMGDFVTAASYASLEIVGLACLLSVSMEFANQEQTVQKGEMNHFIPAFTSFSCYVVMITMRLGDDEAMALFPHPGGEGVLYALAISLLSCSLFFAVARIWRRIAAKLRLRNHINLNMRSAFMTIVPVSVTIMAFALARVLNDDIFHGADLGLMIQDFIVGNLINDELSSVLLTVLLTHVFWFFGAHGSQTMIDIFPQFHEAPWSQFATEDFYLNFVSLGGAGATLGLLIALYAAGSRFHGRRIAKAALIPSLFNINEIIIYGIPIVINPALLLPFVAVPMLIATMCYFAFTTGLVPPIVSGTSWTTPVFISGVTMTGSWLGALLQAVCIAVSFAVYLPFVIVARRSIAQTTRLRFDEYKVVALEAAQADSASLMTRADALGETARSFAFELSECFESNQIPFHLVYQPKSYADGRVMGAEALLRWRHPDFGYISPVVLVEAADEAGLSKQLGRWAAAQGIKELGSLRRQGFGEVAVSVNLNPRHLLLDPGFPDFVGQQLAAHGVSPDKLEFEITERVAVHPNERTTKLLGQLRDLGVRLSIDDMGMGYSSLTYISDFGVGTVKIDASLVGGIVSNKQQQQIVRSIVTLAAELGIEVVVEGVETKRQLEALVAIGCNCFQGYFFSKPLGPSDFAAYLKNHL